MSSSPDVDWWMNHGFSKQRRAVYSVDTPSKICGFGVSKEARRHQQITIVKVRRQLESESCMILHTKQLWTRSNTQKRSFVIAGKKITYLPGSQWLIMLITFINIILGIFKVTFLGIQYLEKIRTSYYYITLKWNTERRHILLHIFKLK